MDLKIETIQNVVVVELIGRLDITSFEDLEGKISELIDGGNVNILLDFSQLNFISSAGLRTLIVSYKKIDSLHGSLKFCALTRETQKIFDITGYDTIFEIFETKDLALASFSA